MNQLLNFESWLEEHAKSSQTKRMYSSHVRKFLSFVNPDNRDFVWLASNDQLFKQSIIRYMEYITNALGLKPSTVNAHLTAIDNFCTFLGLQPADVKRKSYTIDRPTAMTEQEQEQFLRALESCKYARDRAMALLFLYTGIRLRECVALNISDIKITELSGSVSINTVHSHHEVRRRTLPLNPPARQAMMEWLAKREQRFGKHAEEALFIESHGHRLTPAAIDFVLRKIGLKAKLVLSARLLRNTFLKDLAKERRDVVEIVRLSGFKLKRTARRFAPINFDVPVALPTQLTAYPETTQNRLVSP
jgi:site-specific recombinase XerD